MVDNLIENEEALAGLIEAVAIQYRKQMNDPTLSKNEVRVFESLTELNLIILSLLLK